VTKLIKQPTWVAPSIYGLLTWVSLQVLGYQQEIPHAWLSNGFALAYLLNIPKSQWLTMTGFFVVSGCLVLAIYDLNLWWNATVSALNIILILSCAWCASKLIDKYNILQTIPRIFIIFGIYILILSPLISWIMAGFQAYFIDSVSALLWAKWWTSHVIGLLLIFIPTYCLKKSQFKRLLTGKKLKQISLILPCASLVCFFILIYLPHPYIYISAVLSLVALQFGLTLTVVISPVALLIAHIIPMYSTQFVHIWINGTTLDEILGPSAMSAFMANMIALTMQVHRQRQNELIELKERFELASDSIGLGVWDWDLSTNELHWDKHMYALYGVDPLSTSISYEVWKDRVHPDDIDMVEKQLSDLVKGSGEYRLDFRVLPDENDLRWVSASAIVSKDEKGDAQRVVGLNWECTQRKNAESKWQESKKLLQSVIDSAEDFSIITTDPEGTILLFSRGAEKMLGYSARELVNKQSPAVFHDVNEVIEKGKVLSEEFSETIEGFEVFIYKTKKGFKDSNKWTYIHKDGHRIPVRLTVSTVYDTNNQLLGYLGVAQDITLELRSNQIIRETLEQVNQQAQKVEESRQQLKVIFETAPESLIIVNQIGEIIQANSQAHQLFKYKKGTLIGIKIEELVPNEIRSKHQQLRRGFFENVKTRIMGEGIFLQGKCADGELIAVDINLAPYFLRDEKHVIVTVHDVSEQNKIKELLTDAAAKANAMSRAKSEFVASMSHEIRTPMNAVLASSQLLRNTNLDENQNRYVNMIHSAGNSLLGILNDILDFSKIEAGKFELQHQNFDIDEICETLSSVMSSNAASKNIEFSIGVDPMLPNILVGDGPRLQQVLINLLGNAIKFTENGDVTLFIDLVGVDGNQATVKISVRDSGIGIEPEFKETLFSAFSQVDGSNTRKYGGTGLGLAISQRLINMMNGTILVESELGKGSDFNFTLTFPFVDEEPKNFNFSEEITVHIIDSNEINRRIIEMYLKSWGIECFQYSQQNELSLSNTSKNVLLVDAGLDGIEQFISELPNHVKPYVFLMQSDKIENIPKNIKLDSIAGVIHKPILRKTLYNSLIQTFSPSEEIVPSVLGGKKEPLKDYKILLVEDNALNQVVASEILTDLGAHVSIAENGQLALGVLLESPQEFDCVLMDMQMPIMDGFTATRKIRNELKLKLPIIAMTAGVMEKERQHCIDAGMNDFIAKPIDIEKLLITIQANILKH